MSKRKRVVLGKAAVRIPLVPVARVKVVFDRTWGEWIVKAWGAKGQRLKDADYFSGSENRADADATAVLMMRSKGGVA